MFTYTIDDELSLKLIEPNDAKELYQLTDQSRDHLRTWLGWVDGNDSIEHTEGFIKMGMKKYAENEGVSTCIIYKDEIAGIIGTHATDWTNRSASIGYWLGEAFIGRGIMTRATRAMTDYLLGDLKLNRVEIRAAARNTSSRSIPERLGFTKEGQIRQAEWLYDHYVDHVVYSILAEEWKRE
ncbi:ribosomal-protein-serine acetyltransferase [Halobacillus andaensis]|uniref:Ribosomal-protein-serine acetyltransferase n=1 Tax=Halobacillus andaensis TaxID=1176239 RepID=A0A917EW46_HALAA|nr:GNAT family protein [Halobacillus andaensis]MBP2005924.1 ribosomal-protein-serine acetyltransferase [Halobacillus andaensis]GGF25016.1 ribosomal-protein-serine acetyltransferase [Halobacillus andaensis]